MEDASSSAIHNWASWSLGTRNGTPRGKGPTRSVAGGDDPAEDRQLDRKAINVKELCTRYLADLRAGLILGKGGRQKKASTIVTDTGRIERTSFPS
jgi:hypothetical protein